jgi:hypothetical protein
MDRVECRMAMKGSGQRICLGLSCPVLALCLAIQDRETTGRTLKASRWAALWWTEGAPSDLRPPVFANRARPSAERGLAGHMSQYDTAPHRQSRFLQIVSTERRQAEP